MEALEQLSEDERQSLEDELKNNGKGSSLVSSVLRVVHSFRVYFEFFTRFECTSSSSLVSGVVSRFTRFECSFEVHSFRV